MDVFREPVSWTFEGPLMETIGLPLLILYALVVTIKHSAGRNAVNHVRNALSGLTGEPTEHRGLFGKRLEYTGRLPMTVYVTGNRVRVRAKQRVRPTRLRELVKSLAMIPGASDLSIRGQRERFAESGSRVQSPME